MQFNLPNLPSDCKQAITGIWTSPDDGQTFTSCNSACYNQTNNHEAKLLDNNLVIHFEKITNDMSNYYQFAIKAIQISMTCSITCEICLDESNCDVCKYSFKKITLPSGLVVCEQNTNCTENCYSCAFSQTENICLQCLPGYSLQANQCVSLDKNKICKSQPNTYYADPNQCVKYAQNAVKFQNGQYVRTNMEVYYSYKCPNNQVVILYPESYYSLYACGCYTNSCSSCPYGICTTCSDGYKLLNNDCVSICRSNQYFDQLSKKCIDCGTNCKVCNIQTCTLCTDSTFQVDLKNPQNCFSCDIKNCIQCSDQNKCFSCKYGYQLSDDYSSCNFPCQISNCITCVDNSTTNCKQCAQSYTLNTNNQQCVKCNQDQIMLEDFSCISVNSCIVNNCQRCITQNPLSCDTCSLNYYLNLDSSKCLSCFVQNCLVCSKRNYQECQICSENYSLSSDKSQCLQCQIQNCQKCDPENNLICQTCEANTFLNSNQTQCLPCSVQNCQECQSKNYQLCQKCISGYQANNDSKSCDQISEQTMNYFQLQQSLVANGYNVNIIFDNPLVQESVNSLQYSVTNRKALVKLKKFKYMYQG
ncbi:hypothetical protein ABPG74_002102 [Tetrahymena malaccensis]